MQILQGLLREKPESVGCHVWVKAADSCCANSHLQMGFTPRMGVEISNPFSAKLGLGFEDAPAVSYDSFEFKYEDKAVTLHMRSGHTIVEDFEFLEQYVPVAGSYCGE